MAAASDGEDAARVGSWRENGTAAVAPLLVVPAQAGNHLDSHAAGDSATSHDTQTLTRACGAGQR